jgi:hypothetical protein
MQPTPQSGAADAERSANRCLEVGHEGNLSARPRWPRGVRLRGGAAATSRGRRGARAGPRRRRHPHGALLGSDLDHTAGEPRPLPVIPGHEFSGEIAALGAGVRDVGVGDLVYGLNDWYRDGASAEYCVARVADFAHKPAERRSRSRSRHTDFRSDGMAGVGRACRSRRGPAGADPRRGRGRRHLCRAARPLARRAGDRHRLGSQPRLRAQPRGRRGDRLPGRAVRGRGPGLWTWSSTRSAGRR